MSANLYELLSKPFQEFSDSVAIECHERGIWTYGELEDQTARYADWLIGLGVKPGDRVVVQAEKSPEVVFLYLASLKSGAIFLPLNTAYQPAELEFFLSDAEPRIFVCDPKKQTTLEPMCSAKGISLFTLGADGGGNLHEALPKTGTEPVVSREPDDLAALLYTSGTTGRSKGAMITHHNLSSNALTLHRQWGFIEGDVLLHSLPIYHVHGLFVALHCALLNGSKMIWMRKYDPELVSQKIREASVFMGVPTHYTRLLKEESFGKECCSRMRLFVSGSAPLLKETFEQFRQRTGHTILERYGMTEAGMITSNPYNGNRIAGTVGFPLEGISARVSDETGKELKDGEIGTLEIKGPNVFKGYWKLPEKTKEEFREDGFFITGDLACRDQQGYLSIVGRGKDLIISGGLNVYPKEVEDQLNQIEGVQESAVFGLSHSDFGEAVTAVIVSNHNTFSEELILEHLRPKLASFKLPKRILPVSELPRNSMGKVQKKLLREQHSELYQN